MTVRRKRGAVRRISELMSLAVTLAILASLGGSPLPAAEGSGQAPAEEPRVGGFLAAAGFSAHIERHVRKFGVGPATGSNDPLSSAQTYLAAGRFPEAWRLVPGAPDVTVGVIDVEFDLPHPDLKQAVREEAARAPTLAPAGDGRHGNNVLGIIGADGGNGEGIRGAAPGVRLLPIEIRSRREAAEALRTAVRLGARVLNLSWDCDPDPDVLAALREAVAAGCLIVSAPPNGPRDLDSRPAFPMAYRLPGMLVVLACSLGTPTSLLSDSPRGRLSVDLAAPGEAVLTASVAPGYEFASGTSVAAPLVSAAAALMFQACPALDGAEAARILVATARRVPALRGSCVSGGILDAGAAVRRAVDRSRTELARDPEPVAGGASVGKRAGN